ncbi:MAG: hypothetical protein RBR78_10720 [Flavobacteriaceae bacterium]|jgi:hypothetical protein|nr:hypothetical protein [Flavobacteriaceae bacterium]
MKNILITFAFIFSIPIYAQQPVLSLEDRDPYDTQQGAYYKDLANVLTTFEGTWLYTDGNTSLKIVLVKKEAHHRTNRGYYEDLMIGEYQYIENGVEKINTLSDLNQNLGRGHKIRGNDIHRSCYFMPNGDCTEGEVRLNLGLSDVTGKHWATMVIKKRRINGQHALKAYIVFNYSGYDDPPPSPTLPWQQEYIMFKQP